MNITPWNPFREIAVIQKETDRLFGENWHPVIVDIPSENRLAVIDLHEDELAYTVVVELPGVKQENVHVKLDRDYLVVEGEILVQAVEEEKGDHLLVKERPGCKFSRRVRLPQPVDDSKVETTYQDGILTLRLPKMQDRNVRVIPIQASAT